MTLDEALHIIASVHTKDDPDVGFVFLVGATCYDHFHPWSPEDHIEAWRVLRKHLHMQTEPQRK